MSERDWFRVRRDDAHGVEALHASLDTYAYGRHAHETYSVGLCEAGSQTFFCRGATRRTRPGSVILFEPFDLHDGRATTGDGVVYRMLYLDADRLHQALAEEGICEPSFPDVLIDDPVLATAVVRLGRALAEPAEALAIAERHVALAAALARVSGRTPHERAMRHGDEIARVRDLLHDRLSERLTMEELAREAGLSRFRMLRAFQRRYGAAPSAYLRTLRLERAKRRLAAGEAPADVAAALGFVDQAHLTRWFRRAYGITPGRYRMAG